MLGGCPLFPRSVKHLVHALPGSHRMFPRHPLMSLDEFATSSSCGLCAGDFPSATGSSRLSMCLLSFPLVSPAVLGGRQCPFLCDILGNWSLPCPQTSPSQRTSSLCLSRVLSPFSAPKPSFPSTTSSMPLVRSLGHSSSMRL